MPDNRELVEILLIEDVETDAELCIYALKRPNLAYDLVWLKAAAPWNDYGRIAGASLGVFGWTPEDPARDYVALLINEALRKPA